MTNDNKLLHGSKVDNHIQLNGNVTSHGEAEEHWMANGNGHSADSAPTEDLQTRDTEVDALAVAENGYAENGVECVTRKAIPISPSADALRWCTFFFDHIVSGMVIGDSMSTAKIENSDFEDVGFGNVKVDQLTPSMYANEKGELNAFVTANPLGRNAHDDQILVTGNGGPMAKPTFVGTCAVQQNCVLFHGTLTLEELMAYTRRLMSGHGQRAMRKRIDELVSWLGLQPRRHVQFGIWVKRDVLGVELLPVLFTLKLLDGSDRVSVVESAMVPILEMEDGEEMPPQPTPPQRLTWTESLQAQVNYLQGVVTAHQRTIDRLTTALTTANDRLAVANDRLFVALGGGGGGAPPAQQQQQQAPQNFHNLALGAEHVADGAMGGGAMGGGGVGGAQDIHPQQPLIVYQFGNGANG